MVSEPIVTEIAGGWELTYAEDQSCPVVQLRNITRARSGDVIAELDDVHANKKSEDTMIPVSGIRFNLSSLQDRRTISKCLDSNYLEGSFIQWDKIIADVCLRALKLYRNGSPPEEIWPSENVILPTFLIEPVLPLHLPSIIFGHGGVG